MAEMTPEQVAAGRACEEADSRTAARTEDGPGIWHRHFIDALRDEGYALTPTDQRQSGDRVLPPPYDAMGAGDREAWLIYEGLFDGALTDDVRRANAGHPMASWAELKPEAHQALVTVLGQVIPILHAVALNPSARTEPTDG